MPTTFSAPTTTVRRGARGKRMFDIVGASIALLLLSPLMLLIAMAQWCTGSHILFRQERIGRNGRPFMILKFCSMREGEEGKPELMPSQSDERMTPLGRFLRQHHLDELPQLWNVIRGDMSLVGYRPERQFFIEKILLHDPRYTLLYQIRPGITSKATIHNGYTDTMEKMLRRLEMDLEYLNQSSLRTDLLILWKTFYALF